MNAQPTTDAAELTTENGAPNVQQAIPFFMVSSMEASLRFYVDGLGFQRTNQWIVDNKIRWCWLQLGGAALMLQEHLPNSPQRNEKLGKGVSVCFQCRDALAIYHETRARGLQPKTPFVGNGLWVTAFRDPDGFHIDFESPTTVPEETVYSESLQLPTPTQK